MTNHIQMFVDPRELSVAYDAFEEEGATVISVTEVDTPKELLLAPSDDSSDLITTIVNSVVKFRADQTRCLLVVARKGPKRFGPFQVNPNPKRPAAPEFAQPMVH